MTVSELQKQLDLSEYMLTMINAFLSGGEYLPHRMVYQKMALLSGMVSQYTDLNMTDRAVERMRELIETRNSYENFIKIPEDKHCLMFPEGDEDGKWHITPENIKGYVDNAWKKLSGSAALQNTSMLKILETQL